VSIYRRDEVDPEWEPVPWGASKAVAAAQERGFHARAGKTLAWTAIPFAAFPSDGFLGHSRDWFTKIDAAFHAVADGEDWLLIDNTWFGWPDPPQWGLVTRPVGRQDLSWHHWGHFPALPEAWRVPSSQP